LILLVSLDTFRADLLEARRADGTPLTPVLDRVAGESLRYSEALAFMPYTLPSHMTMFTGLHHETHYVVTEKNTLAPEFRTLGEAMREAGYRTVGVFTSHFLRGDFGFGRGFDTWRELPVELTFAGRVTDEAVREIDAAAGDDRPLFLFLHFFDPHSDFDFAGNRLAYFSAPEDRRDLAVGEADLCDDRNRCATELLLAADREKRPLAERQVELYRRLYERGVMDLDAQLGRLFSALDQRGLWQDSLVVITGDHGEEFREHGRFLHSQVHRETLRVPLLLHWPKRLVPRTETRTVGLDSVTTTLVRAAGGEVWPGLQGADLLAPGGAGAAEVPHVSQDKLARTKFGLRSGRDLLVWDFATGEAQLFDRGSDPDERVNLAAERPERATELQAVLFSSLRALRSGRSGIDVRRELPFSDREQKMLRSLGYL